MENKIPVTVLTGFLGSGKTTLLNRIISEQHGLRIAVIENEFGEIGIDQELVINADEEIFEMNNGCICCKIRGDLIRILGELIDRNNKFDRVVLETTGMADPGPVAQTFFVDEFIREHYELDGIITLVDTKHINQHLDTKTSEVLTQIAFADSVILNKADLTTENTLLQLKRRLKGINNIATFYSATMADAPVAELLNIGGFNLEHALNIKPNFLEPEYPFEWGGIWDLPAGNFRFQLSTGPDEQMLFFTNSIEHIQENSILDLAEKHFMIFSNKATILHHNQMIKEKNKCYNLQLSGRENYEFNYHSKTPIKIVIFSEHTPEEFDLKLVDHNDTIYRPTFQHSFNAEHKHDDSVSSVSIELHGLFDINKINAWFDVFLQIKGVDIYRMKGVVAVKGEENEIIFQGVHMIFSSQQGKPWGDKTPISRIVFIGKDLDKSFIYRSLQECMYSKDELYLEF